MSRPRAQSTRGLWTAIGVLLTPVVVVPLLVPLFDQATPELAGFPFYFWFQLALVPLAALLTLVAFSLATKADQRDREARGVRTATPGESTRSGGAR